MLFNISMDNAKKAILTFNNFLNLPIFVQEERLDLCHSQSMYVKIQLHSRKHQITRQQKITENYPNFNFKFDNRKIDEHASANINPNESFQFSHI